MASSQEVSSHIGYIRNEYAGALADVGLYANFAARFSHANENSGYRECVKNTHKELDEHE